MPNGGGAGRTPNDEPADPGELFAVGDTLVVDDVTPTPPGVWPPWHAGAVDVTRLHWLSNPALRAVELRLAPDLATVVAVSAG